MEKNKERVISVLNGLIETCKDGEKGFREAAEWISNAFYQSLFNDYARQRGQFASRLQAQVRELGSEPDRKGSVAGAVHRGWLNLKSAIARKNDQSIIAVCRRGEEAAIENYEAALKADLPEVVMSLVESQYQVIKEQHHRIQAMLEKR